MGTAFASVAGSIIASSTASSAAGKAANLQLAGSTSAIAEQRRQFDITAASLAPFAQTGVDALNQQRILLGLGALPTQDQQLIQAAQTGQFGGGAQAALDPFGQPLGADTSIGTVVEGGIVSDSGALLTGLIGESQQDQVGAAEGGQQQFLQQATDAQQNRLGQAAATAQQQDQAIQQQVVQAQQRETTRIAETPQLSPAEQQAQALEALNESPGQKFLRERAQKNLLRNTAAIGGLGGGNVRSALVEQGVGFAQQDIQNQFARLGQLAGQGQAATTSVGQFGQASAGQVSSLLQAGGNTRATGVLNQNQAFQQGLSGVFTGIGQALGDQQQGQTLPAQNINPFGRAT